MIHGEADKAMQIGAPAVARAPVLGTLALEEKIGLLVVATAHGSPPGKRAATARAGRTPGVRPAETPGAAEAVAAATKAIPEALAGEATQRGQAGARGSRRTRRN